MTSRTSGAAERRQGAAVGTLIREWRGRCGRSQLEVAMAAGVSQRHLSFIESGRSAPGRDTLVAVSEVMQVPLRERNTLLLAAGYAPLYSEEGLDEPRMQPVLAAARRLLAQQEPYPALLMDRYWNVLAANDAAPRYFGRFIDLEAWPRPRNLLRLVFHPNGLRPAICDWERVSAALVGRIRREAVSGVLDATGLALLEEILAYPGVTPAVASEPPAADFPIIPIGFTKGGVTLRYFSMVATVGTPATVLAQELRVECMFPADDATERDHLPFVNGAIG